MKVAVIGLGQFGKSVALRLSRAGVDVIAVDTNMDHVEDVKNDVSLAVRLDATDERDLRSQGIDTADVLVAAIGDNFEANQLVVVLAKRMGIKRVIAKAASPIHERILRLIGADEVILPDEEAAERVSQRIAQPSLKSYFELIDGYSIAEVASPASFHGKSIAELDLRKRFEVNLIAIKRVEADREDINPVPLPGDVIKPGDILAVAGSDSSLQKLLQIAGEQSA